MPTSTSPPPFLSGGTFVWRRRGYGLSGPLPAEVEADDAEWLTLARSLERAKVGDFTALADLDALVSAEAPPLLMRGALMLMGDAGDAATLARVEAAMAIDSSEVVVAACQAAAFAGLPRLLSPMLDALERTRRRQDRDFIRDAIALIVEDDEGPITNEALLETAELRQHVESRRAELERQAPGAAFFEGRPFDVVELARSMSALLRRIDEESGVAGLFLPLRHKFEASTGIDCSDFFDDDRLQPLAALALLEEFLESTRPLHFAAGARYFYGHRIEG